MPNWCENTLVISGVKRELIESVIKFINGGDSLFDFNKVIPYPSEYARMDDLAQEAGDNPIKVPVKDGYNSGGYEWCVNNWGTKWNANSAALSDICITLDGFSATIYFDTAWSPPNPVVHRLSELFPEVTFSLEYTEPGMGFSGTLIVKAGEVLEDETHDYEESDED